MKIPKDDLHLLLKTAGVGLGDSPIYPILANFNIQKKGSKLCVKSTNSSVYVFCSMKKDSFEEEPDFDILVEGKKFVGFINTRKDKEYEVEMDNNSLLLKTDSISASFPLDAMVDMYPEFPSFAEIQKLGTVSRKRLSEGLSFVQSYLKEDSSSVKETVLEVRNSVAVGGTPSAMGTWKDKELTVPIKLGCCEAKKIVSFLNSFSDVDDIDILETPHHYFFKVGAYHFISCEKLADNISVPKIEGYMDSMIPSIRFSFSQKELLGAIKSLKHTIDSTITDMRLRVGFEDCKKGLQVIFGNSSRNVSVSEIEAEIDPESDESEISMKIDHKVFTEVLKHNQNDTVFMEIYRLKSLAYFVEENEETSVSSEIIMQVRNIS